YISTLERKAIERGLEQGLERGLEQGLERGLEQGLEKGLEQGVLQGRDQGVLIGQQKMLLMLMSQKFGVLSPEVVAQIEAIQDESVLQALVQRILTAVSLADMQIPSQE
ncbi:MAG: hypothetical protein KDD89_06955, partial [Anaerolineales bacterium]|nr:hypothetical protein [Anaerolineales bacterium]